MSVNGIDYAIWNPGTDEKRHANDDAHNVLEQKKEKKRKLQGELGPAREDGCLVMGLISRLTNQKGLDLLNAILPQVLDARTQIVVLGTGDPLHEDSFRYYESAYKGNTYESFSANQIYRSAAALCIPQIGELVGKPTETFRARNPVIP